MRESRVRGVRALHCVLNLRRGRGHQSKPPTYARPGSLFQAAQGHLQAQSVFFKLGGPLVQALDRFPMLVEHALKLRDDLFAPFRLCLPVPGLLL